MLPLPGPSPNALAISFKRVFMVFSQVGAPQLESEPGPWHALGDAQPLPSEVLILSLLVAFRAFRDCLNMDEWCMLVLSEAQRYDQVWCMQWPCMQTACKLCICVALWQWLY